MARFVPLPAFSSTLLMPVQPRNSTVRCIFLAYFNLELLPFPMVSAISLIRSSPALPSFSCLPPNPSPCICASGRSNLSLLCFHILTDCFFRLPAGLLVGKPFVFTTIRIAPGCGGKFENCLRFSLCAPCLRGKSILFIRLRALCHREKSHLLWNQELLDSFAKTPGVGGATKLVPDHVLHGVPNSRQSACDAFRRVTSSRDVPVPEPLPTRASLMLVFGLQDAARAAQVLALLTSSRCVSASSASLAGGVRLEEPFREKGT